MLQCNVISHWLGAYTNRSLHYRWCQAISNNGTDPISLGYRDLNWKSHQKFHDSSEWLFTLSGLVTDLRLTPSTLCYLLSLTHCGLATYIMKLGQHWFRKWLGAVWHLNQSSSIRNIFQGNLFCNSKIFIQESAFENVVCKMLAILFRPKCVKTKSSFKTEESHHGYRLLFYSIYKTNIFFVLETPK